MIYVNFNPKLTVLAVLLEKEYSKHKPNMSSSVLLVAVWASMKLQTLVMTSFRWASFQLNLNFMQL